MDELYTYKLNKQVDRYIIHQSKLVSYISTVYKYCFIHLFFYILAHHLAYLDYEVRFCIRQKW